MSEQSVASAKASVMLYDSNLKKWMASGSSSGLSKVQIYHHIENNTFRVVGRKLQDHEVVLNCSILKGLKYFQATPIFHQWRDNSQIHGLNFASREDAETFALAMERVLDILGHSSMYLSSHRSSQSQPLYQTIGHSGVSLDDYAEYRGWMNSENGDRKSSQSEYGHYRSTSHATNAIHATTPSPSFHSHLRTSSAPPQSPQPLSTVPQPQQPSPLMSGPPPPPPPPPPPANSSISGLATLPRLHLKPTMEHEEMTESSLAAAIASAKLKKTTPSKQNNESMGGEKPFPLKGMANMMDEMARTLARRRAQTENSADVDSTSSADSIKSWSKQNSNNSYSPNKNSSGESSQSLQRLDSDLHRPITVAELEKVRHEMMSEIKEMFSSLRAEITDTIRQEFNRR